MLRQQPALLGQLEQDILDRTVPLADVLRRCLFFAGRTGSAQLREWATHELKGYPRRDAVPEYRVVVAPIIWDVAIPYRGVGTFPVNVQELPDFVREHINETVPLNQSVEQLEHLAAQAEGRSKPVALAVIGGDVWMELWNEKNAEGQKALRMYWAIDPAVIRGVVGQVRTALTEFVVELRSEVGETDELPSTEQTNEALRLTMPWTISGSNITIVAATTDKGDVMPQGDRTTIKGNKTTIKDASGNVSVASAHLTQVNVDAIDVEKIREFAALLTQIAPTLGLAPDEQGELQANAAELAEAADAPVQENGRFRRALEGALRVLRIAGPTAARKLAVTMGDELIREIGSEIVRELPH